MYENLRDSRIHTASQRRKRASPNKLCKNNSHSAMIRTCLVTLGGCGEQEREREVCLALCVRAEIKTK